MYLDHFGLTEAPFRITPHTDFFFSGGNRGATLDALFYAITHDEGIVKVSGEVGSGKTMLCRVLMERLPETVTIIYLANPSLSREDILYAIADELHLDIPAEARAAVVLRALQEHLITAHAQGRQVVVLIDEAHAMPAETLEEIRLLSNLESNRHKLLQLVLFGQPELNEILARQEMRQLKERITHNFALEPLILSDIASYLDFRLRAAGYRGPMPFSDKAINAIAKVSLGLTRRINILADKCLLAAYSQGTHQIAAAEVQAAIKDCEFSSAPFVGNKSTSNSRWLASLPTMLSALLAALLGAGIATWYREAQSPAPSVPPVSVASLATVSLPATASNPAPVSITPPPPVLPARTGDLTRERVETGSRWLSSADDQHWFLQLMASDASHPEAIETFIKKATNAGLEPDKLHAYFIKTNNLERFGVIYGDFTTQTDAINHLKSLPPAVQESHPYPRQVKQLR